MARRGLRLELRTVLREAMEGNRTTVRDDLEVSLPDGRIRKLSLIVKPLAIAAGAEPLFLVVFDATAVPEDPAHRRGKGTASGLTNSNGWSENSPSPESGCKASSRSTRPPLRN